MPACTLGIADPIKTASFAAMQEAVRAVGSESKLATAVGTSQQNINRYCRRRLVDPALVRAIEKVSGVPRHRLRPDLFEPG